ncbi:MAG: gluconate 2-dehydrogenase subunit 3 family protein [Myxococcota bacterium]|nr:gluconate 2-dehydrogenase subunit 3 family protein [Myxococcota bacterium]
MTLQSVLLRVLPLPPPGRALAECEWRTLVAIAEVLYPGPDREVSPDEIADNVERFLVRGRSKRAWRIRALLQLVEWVPVAAFGKPLTKLPLEERRRVVEEHYVEGRGLWAICAKIRYMVLLGAYGDPRLHGPTSYVPVPKRRRFLVAERNGGTAVSS